MKNEIHYQIIEGSLPIGVFMRPETGEIYGDIDHINIGTGPRWISPSPGSLGTFDEGDIVEIGPFEARLDNDELAFMGTVNRGSMLPFGLVFNPSTGMLTGTVAELLSGAAIESMNRDVPIWETAPGRLAGCDEGDTVELSVAARGVNDKEVVLYTIVKNGLPWGLRLNTETGEIAGTICDLLAPGLTIEEPKLPLPVWNTNPGAIAVFKEGEAAPEGLRIQATAAEDRTIVKYVIRSGGLPFGLRLDQVSGEIKGRAAELIGQNDPAFYENDKDPQISNTVTIQGAPTQKGNATSLGEFSLASEVEVVFEAIPYSGRTTSRWEIMSGTLPRGLVLRTNDEKQCVISGTLSNHESVTPGLHSFTLRVFDNANAWSVRNYTITTI